MAHPYELPVSPVSVPSGGSEDGEDIGDDEPGNLPWTSRAHPFGREGTRERLPSLMFGQQNCWE